MAEVSRFVNTAADGAGNGTTNGTTGSTGAYASLSAWESAEQTDLVTDGDTHVVDCCGSDADTTAVSVAGWTTGASNGITIRSNRSDANGFYDGAAVISSSHYRIVLGNDASPCLQLAQSFVTVDGLQFEHGHTGTLRETLEFGTFLDDLTVRNCRLRNTATTNIGIGNVAQCLFTSTYRIENNLIVGYETHGLNLQALNNRAPVLHCYHNTIYGNGATGGEGILVVAHSGGAGTWNIKGNVLANHADDDISDGVTGVGSNTLNQEDNATEDLTGEVTGITPADVWTSPGVTAASDFTLKDTGSDAYQIVNPTLLTEDITGFTRDGTNHDAGAFEFQAAGGGATVPIFAHHYNQMRAA